CAHPPHPSLSFPTRSSAHREPRPFPTRRSSDLQARRVYIRAVHGLAESAAANGDHERVADCAGRIVMTDPFDETAHHRLIAALRSEETRLNSSHVSISYAVFCLKKKKIKNERNC